MKGVVWVSAMGANGVGHGGKIQRDTILTDNSPLLDLLNSPILITIITRRMMSHSIRHTLHQNPLLPFDSSSSGFSDSTEYSKGVVPVYTDRV